jgi:hypothetical protein
MRAARADGVAYAAAFLARLTYDGLRQVEEPYLYGLHVASANITAELSAVAAPTLLVWEHATGSFPSRRHRPG